MKSTLNAHRLLTGTISDDGYLDNIDISQNDADELNEAKSAIRDSIRIGFKATHAELRQSGLFDAMALLHGVPDKPIVPRFMTQGSFAYKTVNDPAHNPPQEIDLDDGMYLPVSFISMRGTVRPSIASKELFRFVEGLLMPLCTQRGWELDRSKTTCIRVQISLNKHIDLPMYSVPDEEFEYFTEALDKSVAFASRSAKTTYRVIPTDKIMLAHRNGEWEPSDPRKIGVWFRGAVSNHGAVLRRVCRYLKAWRDHQWANCKLSSITLMAVAVTVFDELNGELPADRDDLALLWVAERLPALFAGPIKNPVLPSLQLDDEWTDAERHDFQAKASSLYSELRKAMGDTFVKSLAIGHFQNALGQRVPNNQMLLTVQTAEEEVKSYPAIQVSAPTVLRSISG